MIPARDSRATTLCDVSRSPGAAAPESIVDSEFSSTIDTSSSCLSMSAARMKLNAIRTTVA
jgi:hypothetical protein